MIKMFDSSHDQWYVVIPEIEATRAILRISTAPIGVPPISTFGL